MTVDALVNTLTDLDVPSVMELVIKTPDGVEAKVIKVTCDILNNKLILITSTK